MTKQLVYFADPMCSWCWGFSPVIAQVRQRAGEAMAVRLVMGGLSPGQAEVMDEKGKAEIREHWEHVAEASGQPFEYGFFERQGFVYDTQSACQAVVAVRRIDPASAFAFLDCLHHAFYAENRDVTDLDVLVEIAAEFGLEPARFRAEFEAIDTYGETRGDFLLSRQIGITGFPALIAGEKGKFFPLSLGYQSWDKLAPGLNGWLRQAPA